MQITASKYLLAKVYPPALEMALHALDMAPPDTTVVIAEVGATQWAWSPLGAALTFRRHALTCSTRAVDECVGVTLHHRLSPVKRLLTSASPVDGRQKHD